jgi:hypothetical protein
VKFDPPKPTMEQGIQDLRDLFQNQFITKSFKDGITAAFVSTGTVPSFDKEKNRVCFPVFKFADRLGTTPLYPTNSQKVDITELEHIVEPVVETETSQVRSVMDLYLDEDSDNENDDDNNDNNDDFNHDYDDDDSVCDDNDENMITATNLFQTV